MSSVRTLFATALLCAPPILATPACGTLLFPERKGQSGGKADPNIILLDGLGLLLFIIPGLIAFGVDFATGAIYLPPGETEGEGPFWGQKTPAPDPDSD